MIDLACLLGLVIVVDAVRHSTAPDRWMWAGALIGILLYGLAQF